MLQRIEGRRRELETRAALGATPRQLATERLVEGALLGVSACVLGIGLSAVLVRLARVSGGAALTGLASVQMSGQVVVFAVAVSLGAALLASLLPCAIFMRDDLPAWIHAPGSLRPTVRSLPSSIVVAQVGISVGLVVVGSMLAKDFSRLATADIGYEPRDVLMAQVAISRLHHADGGRQFFNTLLKRMRDLPGVQAAALVLPTPGIPMIGGMNGRVEGYGDEFLSWRAVSASFFSLLKIPIVAGRPFTELDEDRGEPVVVVNESFADRYWGGPAKAISKSLRFGSSSMTVIGVSRDVGFASVRPSPELYVNYATAMQLQIALPEMSLLVKAAHGNLRPLTAALGRLAEEVDRYQPLYNVRALENLARADLAQRRLLLLLLGAFAGLATILAAAGMYVVLAFAVARRTQELGIRLALGASRPGVVRLVLSQAVALAAKGIALTLPITFCVIWLFAAQVFGVTDTDAGTYLWAVGVVLTAAAAATIVPAWRAIRIDPMTALRHE